MKHTRFPTPVDQRGNLLIEIGTEELPAAYLDATIAQLRETERLLEEAHVEYEAVESYGTPRRLVLLVHHMSLIQQHPGEEIRGPSKQVAFDAAGKPTPSLQGFLRSRNGTLAQLKTVATEKGEYLYLAKSAFTVPSTKILPELIRRLIVGLRFPKTMRWDESTVRFARPIRWLLALLDGKPLRVQLGRLTSAPVTVIGGPKRPQRVAVKSIAAYQAVLKRDGVILDHRARRQRIEQLVRAAAKKAGGIAVPEMAVHGLLDEVTGLAERPVSVVGRFDPAYLGLPREVLLASMAKHQRVFAVQSSSGRLLPVFVGILDGAPRRLAAVRAVMEHILNARLADASMFWEQDRAQSLTVMARQVSGVTFHEKLGSMAEKQTRLQKLAEALSAMWSLSTGDTRLLRRACELAKADLVSTMVKEFPTLQGVMGKYYAAQQGEPREVAEALAEQYLPLAGNAPKTLIGSALAVLDKYDTLNGYFAIGIEPTGDQDPFGLRRAAQGIVEITWRVHRPLRLGALSTAATKVNTYLLERLYTFAWPKVGSPAAADTPSAAGRVPPRSPVPSRDIIEAVLASRPDDLVDAMDRVVSLTRLNGNRALLKAAKIIERTANILKGAKRIPQAEPEPSRFQDPLEGKLWNLLTARKPDLDTLIANKSYGEATTLYGEVFYDPLHEFFAKVMVNVEDPQIQQNRLALMRSLNALYTARIADLSKLALLQEGTV